MARTYSTGLRRGLERAIQVVARRWRGRFYVHVALLFTLGILIDAGVSHYSAQMRLGAYDLLVRHRFRVPPVDPSIVIVDIDEASLASMGLEYGRWPWPRQVLGEFLEQIERQKPRAVVFDILFSDADVYNRDSDAAFDAAIAGAANSYFPFLRLPESADALSQIPPGRIPGVLPVSGEPQGEGGIAVVLPHFDAALKGGRLGFHNIYPDSDGIVREYLVRRAEQGWELPSLPLRLGRDLGWQSPSSARLLLNWRGPALAYPRVSFKDLYEDWGSRNPQRPRDEFTGKIVLLGSTAPALFDIKATPVSRLHPGVEILATAIDNLKQGDYLRSPRGDLLYPLLTLLIVWATAWSFYRDVGRARIDRLFGASQFILIGISYASINFTTTYINLSGPVTVGIGYFTLARIYALATAHAMERDPVRNAAELAGSHAAGLLLLRLPGADERVLERIRRRMERAGAEPLGVSRLQEGQSGVWELLEDTLAVSWFLSVEDGAARIEADVLRVSDALLEAMRDEGLTEAQRQCHVGRIHGGSQAGDAWRGMLAQALGREPELLSIERGPMT
ncbi:MAG: hypothetical protein RLZZ200_8 [Pseudomonadota bacterium]|jgi:CHASE2 domain-containing sensor protein